MQRRPFIRSALGVAGVGAFGATPATARGNGRGKGKGRGGGGSGLANAEALLGEGNGPGGDIEGAREALSWGEVYGVDERIAVTAAGIVDEVGSEGLFLSGTD